MSSARTAGSVGISDRDANEISGDIVLRAAKRGRNASELMGVVLSRYLIRHELGTNRRFGWYFRSERERDFGRHRASRREARAERERANGRSAEPISHPS